MAAVIAVLAATGQLGGGGFGGGGGYDPGPEDDIPWWAIVLIFCLIFIPLITVIIVTA